MAAITYCADCRWWDKDAFKHPANGICRFPLPMMPKPLPFWVEPLEAPNHFTASYQGRNCPTWEQKPVTANSGDRDAKD